jgi:Fic family protein
LVDALFETPIVTIPRVREILGVTYPAAKQHVDKLVRASVLVPFGERSYGKAFAAEEILNIIGT